MRRDLLERYLGKDEIFKRGIELKAESLERELAGGNPSPLERLLIERVTICWIDMYMVDNISSRIHTDPHHAVETGVPPIHIPSPYHLSKKIEQA